MEQIRIIKEMREHDRTENEVVHHINGRKSDNRPENLAVMTKSEHSKLHWMIRRYNPVSEENVKTGKP